MKRIKNIALSIIILAIASCSENEQTTLSNAVLLDGNAYVDRGILHIPDPSFYRGFIETKTPTQEKAFIESLDKIAGYTSLRNATRSIGNSGGRTYATKELELVESNDFISTLLNANGMISIGDYYFKINLGTERALVLAKEHAQELADLENENLENENIMVFSTSDDVLDLLEAGVTNGTNGRTQLCFEGGADQKEDKEDRNYCANRVRMDNKVVYQKLGIYFSLQAKSKVYLWFDGNWISPDAPSQEIVYYVKFEPKCSGVTENSGTRYDGWSDNEMSYRPYERSTGLHKYFYQARFKIGFANTCGDFYSRDYLIRDGF
jgi:hypothetical protein